ncbi:MAG: alpha/beta hydrolase [Anaerolineales bacterium]|nr:alpha/beta hydrolase [Anaerolineales bacterium]
MFKTSEGQARYFAAYDSTLALWPVPVESVAVPTRFGKTHVNVCGPQNAPPLVLIHGQAISSTMWYPNVGALSQHYSIYAPDILGDMGKSVQTQPFKQPSDFADWIGELLDGLQVERAALAGLSYGGFVAAQTALSRPERVTKLILMAPASLLSIRPVFFLRMFLILWPGLSTATRQKLITGTANPLAAPAIRQMMTTTDFRYSMYLPPNFTDEQLRQIRTPTLLMLGDGEVIYDYKAALSRAQKFIPNLQTALIPNAGHALNFDQPEMVNARILEFLT